jgi:hypothetical protein
MTEYTENDFFNDLNKYIDLDIDQDINIDIDNVDILYNYILNTKKGIKQTKILVLYGNTKNIVDIIKKYLLSGTFSLGYTNLNYFQNLIVDKYINKMKNTHPIYNITRVNKLFIISDNENKYTLNCEIFQKLLSDNKIITNFIITTNKKSKDKDINDIFISVLE